MFFDAVVVGGGFYGATIAAFLARKYQFSVLLIERESKLMGRASANNQARVHNGYHYPRSFTTAYRSRIHLDRFVRDWPGAIFTDFVNLYAIARRQSKVTVHQFTRFCNEIGAELSVAPPELKGLFDSRLIEEVFLTKEYTFNHQALAALAKDELQKHGVHVSLCREVVRVSKTPNGTNVESQSNTTDYPPVTCRYLFNCTYSGLNRLGGDFARVSTGLKHEIAEMALVRLPPVLTKLGVTVMDGAFFSFMPFPTTPHHTLSHVRYTPHLNWQDDPGIDPYQKLQDYPKNSRFSRMLRDASRYLPALATAEREGSLFEVRTVLEKNEVDDGRPILFEKHPELTHCYSILGGKIDNIYDVLEKIEDELAQ